MRAGVDRDGRGDARPPVPAGARDDGRHRPRRRDREPDRHRRDGRCWADDAEPESLAGSTVTLNVNYLAAARGQDLTAHAVGHPARAEHGVQRGQGHRAERAPGRDGLGRAAAWVEASDDAGRARGARAEPDRAGRAERAPARDRRHPRRDRRPRVRRARPVRGARARSCTTRSRAASTRACAAGCGSARRGAASPPAARAGDDAAVRDAARRDGDRRAQRPLRRPARGRGQRARDPDAGAPRRRRP